MKLFYEKLVRHFLNLLVVKITGNEGDLSDFTEDELEQMKRQAADTSRETLQRLLDILMAEDGEVRRSADPRLNLEFMLIKMTYLDPMIPINEMVSRMEDLEKRLVPDESGTRRIPPVDPNPGTDQAKVQNGQEKYREHENARTVKPSAFNQALGSSEDLWARFTDFAKQKDHPLWSKIVQGAFLGYEQNTLRIGFPKGSVLPEIIDQPKLAEIGREFFGTEGTIKIETDANGKDLAMRNGMSQNKNHAQIRREALKHPLVQKVMDIFEGAQVKEVITKK